MGYRAQRPKDNEKVNEYIRERLDECIIIPSSSEYANPVILLKMKDDYAVFQGLIPSDKILNYLDLIISLHILYIR